MGAIRVKRARLVDNGTLELKVEDASSDAVYEIYTIEPSLLSSLLDLLAWGGMRSADYLLYVVAPDGAVHRLTAFSSRYDKDVWIRRAREATARDGVDGLRSVATAKSSFGRRSARSAR